MSDMPEPQHARAAISRSTTATAAWAIIVCLGGTQVWFNVSAALKHSSLSPVPVLAGLAPVLGSVLLSHLAASSRARAAFRVLVTAIMLGSMAVSIGATVEVAKPVFASNWRAVLLGIVLDSASLAALWFIMDRHAEKAAALSAVEQAQATAQAAEKRARSAEAQAQEAVGEAAGRASEAVADAAAKQEQLDVAKAELAAVKAELQGLRSGLNKRRGSGRNSTRSSGPRKPSGSGAGSGSSDAVSTEAQALAILAGVPEGEEISGAELGRRLGVSESYGCRLKRDFEKTVPSPEQAQ